MPGTFDVTGQSTVQTVAAPQPQPAIRFDPITGQALQPQQSQARFDPITGQALQPSAPQQTQARFDPMTGQALQPAAAPQPAVVRSPAQPAAMGFPQPAAPEMRFDPVTGVPLQPQAAPQFNQPAQPEPRAFNAQQPGSPWDQRGQQQPAAYPIPMGTPAQNAIRQIAAPVNPIHVDANYAAQFPGVSYEAAQRAHGGSAGMPTPGMVGDGQMRWAANGVDPSGIPADPAQFRDAMCQIMGNTPQAHQAAEVMAQAMDAKIRSLGLDRVDRRHLAFPETHAPQQRSDLAMEVFSRAGVAPTPKAQAMEAWMRFILFGRDIRHLSDDQGVRSVVVRALTEGIDSEGGFVVPPGFVNEIIQDAPKLSGLYQYCRRIPVSVMAGEIPSVAKNAGVGWGTEGIKFGEDDPALGSKNFAIKRLNALVRQSRELVNDSNPSIVDLVVELFREQIVEERDRVVSLGNGMTEPLGLANSPALIDLTANVQEVNWANLVTMKETVDDRYQMSPSFRWWFNQNMKAEIMKLVDDVGRPLIQLDPTEGFTPRLLGKPVSIENHLPNTYAGIGDLRYYMIFDRETLGMERSTEAGTAFEQHELMIKFWERWDGKPVAPPRRPMAHTKGIVFA